MASTPLDQIYCENCKGGNPSDATTCMWCGSALGQTVATSVASPENNLQTAPGSAEPAGETDTDRIKEIKGKVSQILSKGETIEYVALESKPVQINIAPDAVVLTNRRLIMYRPRVLGQVEFEDYIWRDLHDARMKEGVLRAVFIIDVELPNAERKTIEVHDLMKEQARRVYQYAQQMEEYMVEERRVRDLEEKRAESGGVFMQSGGSHLPSYTAGGSTQQEDSVQKLKQLKEMLDSGLITSAIYEAKRNEILSKM